MGKWVPSYELVKAPSEAGFLGLQSDRRAYELVEEGFTSKNASYVFESRRVGKYTEFRCKERVSKSLGIMIAPAPEEMEMIVTTPSLESLQAGNLKWFESLELPL